MLEVVVAMAVIFLTLLGFAGFSVVAHTGMSASEKLTRAVTLAQEKMEDVKRVGIPDGLSGPSTTTEPYGSMAAAPHHQRVLTIKPNEPMPGLQTVIVEVQWDAGARSTTLKTYLIEE